MTGQQALTAGASASVTFALADRVQAYQNIPSAVRAGGGAVATWASARYLKGHVGAAAVGASAAVAIDGTMDLIGL